jgi:hypothetical protein
MSSLSNQVRIPLKSSPNKVQPCALKIGEGRVVPLNLDNKGLSFKELKDKQRKLRDGFPTNLGLRVHRSLSWIQRAELSNDDPDAHFIFLWIAFNAAYSENTADDGYSERSIFDSFFVKLLNFDTQQLIYKAIWRKFSGAIRLLIDNQYVFQPFWNHQNGLPGHDDWEDRFTKSKRRMHEALTAKDTRLILGTVFDRLYVLRNQIVHGGATWNSSINRSQIRDGAEILSFLVPVFVTLMMDNPEYEWRQPHYPVVE